MKAVIAKANQAQTTDEAIAIVESSDVYKRGYARQTTEMKLAIADAKTKVLNAQVKYKGRKAAEEQGYGSVSQTIDASSEESDAILRLYRIYVLVMNDG